MFLFWKKKEVIQIPVAEPAPKPKGQRSEPPKDEARELSELAEIDLVIVERALYKGE